MTGIIRADSLRLPLRDESVHLIVTSPPYYALRSYRDGGDHYDGQIGSEATPQAFLEALWAVTAECWRVLKPSGSMFVNLGDTRSGSGGPGGDYNEGGLKAGRPRSRRLSIGRPSLWTNQNAAWLAGVIDCDGSISVRQNIVPEGRSPSFVPWVRVGQMTNEVVDRCAEITGVGQVFQDKRGVWIWNASAQQTAYVLERIWPWLRIKKRQALAAIALAHNIAENDNGLRLERNTIAWRVSMREAVQAWNKGRPAWLSVPTPEKITLPDYEIRPRRKSKMLLPHRYAIGCEDGLADPDGVGWIVRQDGVWQKLNGLPESVTDRTRDSHEYIFHLTKSERYFSAVDELREPHAPKTFTHRGGGKAWGNDDNPDNNWTAIREAQDNLARVLDPRGKVPGSVWPIASEPLTVPDWIGVDHFAAFPQEIPRRLILGWSPSGICTACGEGRRPVVAKELQHVNNTTHAKTRSSGGEARTGSVGNVSRESATITGYACACTPYRDHPGTSREEPRNSGTGWAAATGDRDIPSGGYGNAPRTGPWREYLTAGWTPPPTRPSVVLDPFGGTGTTAMVARALGRVGVNVDLSADYCRLARWRVFSSGHASKTRERTNIERQGTFL